MAEENQQKQTQLGELGEFGLIEKLTGDLETCSKTTIFGVGDDAAIIECSKDEVMVVTTDMLVEKVHFDMIYTPLKHLGYKAVVVNLSDIAAMNAVPHQITVSISVSSKYSVEAIEEIYFGIKSACEKYKVDLVGGDTSASVSGLTISITAIGRAKKKDVIYRNGAKENELLCVTGDLGGAFVGLNILEREKRIFLESPTVQPDLGTNHYAIERQLKPEARTDLKEILSELGIAPSSMIDISDGLASEAIHLARASGLGCKLHEEKFPIDPEVKQTAIELSIDPSVCVMNGGEDYELLFTVAQSDYDKIKSNPDITVVGHMCDKSEGYTLITSSGNQYDLKAQGWNAFIANENKLDTE